MQKIKYFPIIILALVLASGWLVLQAAAQAADPGAQATQITTGAPSLALELPAEGGSIASLSGSFVVFDPSVGGASSYFPGASQTFCFRAESFTTDNAYVYYTWLRFPADVTVSNAYVQGTPSCTSTGSWGPFSYWLPNPNEVRLNHTRYQAINDHCTAYYCVDVTSGAGHEAALSWYWDGDEYGSLPYHPCSSDAYTPAGSEACDEAVLPTAQIPAQDIDLSPAFTEEQACACEWQSYTLTATNLSGIAAAFDLSYTLEGPGLIQAPTATVTIPDGGTRVFDVRTRLDGCMLPGATITATVQALEPVSGLTAEAVIVRHYAEEFFTPAGWQPESVTAAQPAYWQTCAVGTNPAAAGEVAYQVGGLDVSMATQANLQMYDPGLDTWTQLTVQPQAVFGAVSGWMGGQLYVAGGYSSVGFSGVTDLQVYDPATGAWDNTTYPDLPAAGGRGGVSGGVGTCHTGSGSCLFTVGGGPTGNFADTTLETWEYDPGTNAWTQLDARPAGVSTNGTLLGGGVGCLGYIFAGGDYRGYHDFFRLDAAQPAGSQWTAMAGLPAEAGAMSPAMVCMEDEQAIYLIGGSPSGSWSNFNTTMFRYDMASDSWSGPLAQTLATGVLGSCGLYFDDHMWNFGGTRGTGALNPAPHDSLERIFCSGCMDFSATKQALPEAEHGQVITYTIVLESSGLQPGIFLTDTLPAGVQYAGGLTSTLGTAWYASLPDNAIFWTLPSGLKTDEVTWPDPAPAARPSPAAVAEDVGAGPEASLPAAASAAWARPQKVLWDNGPLVTHPGGGAGGADASALQTEISMNTYGLGQQFSVGNRMADDFTITNPLGWQIDTLTFFSHHTGAPVDPSPATGVYFQIWDGPPDDAGSSVVFGDLTTNRLVSSTWSGIYRVLDTSLLNTGRAIFANTASAAVHLPPGTYWIDWMTDGDSTYTGPWAPPVVLLGQTTTGNALQYTTSSSAWAPAVDSGTLTPQGMPFIVQGVETVEITFNATVTGPAYSLVQNQGVVTCGVDSDTFASNTRVLGVADIFGSVPLLPLSAALPPDQTHTTSLDICNAGSGVLAWGIGELPPGYPLSSWSAPRIELPARASLPEPGPEIQASASASLQESAPAAPAHPAAVLWDQPSNHSGGIIDQYFPDFSVGVYSADDFVITHTWMITNIFVNGSIGFASLVNSDHLNWCFYAEVGSVAYGYPRAGGEFTCLSLLPSDPNLTFYDSGTSVALNLSGLPGGPLILPPGKYWMSFYPELNFTLYGQWFWDASFTTHGQLAQVIDPTNLLSRGWYNWTPWTAVTPGTYDAAFRFEGQELNTPWLSEAPTSGLINPAGCTSVSVTFDSSGLPVGSYTTLMFINSNDPDESFLYSQVTMVVKLYEVYLPTAKKDPVP